MDCGQQKITNNHSANGYKVLKSTLFQKCIAGPKLSKVLKCYSTLQKLGYPEGRSQRTLHKGTSDLGLKAQVDVKAFWVVGN